MKVVRLSILSFIYTTILLMTSFSYALTSDELFESDAPEIAHYLSGLADMLVNVIYIEGSEEQSHCIYEWFYNNDGIGKVHGYLQLFPDRQVDAIFIIIAKRECPDSENYD